MIVDVELSAEALGALDALTINLNQHIDDVISAAIINYLQYLEITHSVS